MHFMIVYDCKQCTNNSSHLFSLVITPICLLPWCWW